MSSFYEDASLVMIPSGYKTSKVYSAKPTDGAGDLVFTRSNDTATRVNSAGLIEKVRTNLLTYSQAFDNAAYNKGTGGSVSANTVVAPDGTTTADAYTFASSTSTFAYLSHQASSTSTLPHTFSIYIKRPTGSGSRTLRLVISDVTTTTGISSNFTITESWQRFEFTRTSGSSTGLVGIGFALASSGVSIAAGEVLDVWGAQLETGDIATDYIATTSAAVSVGPVANVPRLDYLGSSCPRLLLEPQSTSLILFSEQMDNAAWTKANLSVTANQTASPTGYSDADSLAEQAVSGIHYTGQGITSAAAGTYTFSCFLKQGTTQYGGFRAVVNGFTNRYFVLLDLSNGSVVNTNTTASGVTWTHKVDNYGNGWYRLSVTAAHTSGNIDISISTSDTATPTYFGGLPTYLGTNKFIYAWGANITATGYLQSYIPTLGAAVTRGADAASKTGISSLIGQTEGTIYFEGSSDTIAGSTNLINFNFAANSVVINRQSTGIIRALINTASAIILDSSPVSGIFKAAIGYKNGDSVLYVNGTLADSSTNSFTFATALTEVNLGTGIAYFAAVNQSKCNQALLFKTRLSNSSLAELTA